MIITDKDIEKQEERVKYIKEDYGNVEKLHIKYGDALQKLYEEAQQAQRLLSFMKQYKEQEDGN